MRLKILRSHNFIYNYFNIYIYIYKKLNLNTILHLNHSIESWRAIFSLNSKIYSSIYKQNYNKCLILEYIVPLTNIIIVNYY